MTIYMNGHNKNKKAQIAHTLAWLLTEPDEEMVLSLRNGDIYHLFSDYFESDHRESPSLKGFFLRENGNDLLREMREEYQRLFQDQTSHDLWWVESVHKPWTNDPECRLSIAREKGYVMGDSALHMIDLYRSFGLEVSEGFPGLPDHIVLELEFLGFLIEKSSEESVRRFLVDHLDWVPEMVKRGREHQPSSFYRSVFEAIEAFVALETKEVNREASRYV
jgi:TorA maturation chaperone TorD